MKIKRLAALLFCCVLMTGLLTGCGETVKTDVFEPTASGVYIRDDGTMAGAEVSDFSKGYYSLSELKTFVEEQVRDYNTEKAGLNYAYAASLPEGYGPLPVSISRLELLGSQVVLVLDCQKAEDYVAINDLELISGGFQGMTTTTIGELKEAGRSVSGEFVNRKGETTDVSKIMRYKDYHVVTVSGSTNLQVQGQVMYVSTGVTVVDDANVVTPTGISVVIYK